MTLATQRSRQRLIDGPSKRVYALMDRRVADACATGQVFECSCVAVERKKSSSSLILSLLRCCGPSAVVRLVMSIRVFAIDRVLCGRAWSHVGIKRCEVTEPSTAHRDTASAVIHEIALRFVSAALFHIEPDAVFGGVGTSMCNRARTQLLNAQTSAGRRYAAFYIAAVKCFLCPAVAAAAVTRMFRIGLRLTVGEHGESSEPRSRLNSWHGQSYHASALIKGMC